MNNDDVMNKVRKIFLKDRLNVPDEEEMLKHGEQRYVNTFKCIRNWKDLYKEKVAKKHKKYKKDVVEDLKTSLYAASV